MRVLVATDTFAGTLTAVLAADAITEGWLQQAPHDEIRRVPMSDGGPGFLDVLHNALGGELLGVHTTARSAPRCRQACSWSTTSRTSRARKPAGGT